MPKRKPITWLVIVFGDTHTNSTRGLRPPEYVIKGGEQCHAPKRIVDHLWEPWCQHWRDVAKEKKRLAKRGPVKVLGVFNGDGVDRSYHDKEGYELLTPVEDEIVHIAEMVLEPALDVVDKWIFNRGTRAHEGGTSKLMETLARAMRDRHGLDIVSEDDQTLSQFNARVVVGGVDMLFSHHPISRSRLAHTRQQAAARSAMQYWLGYAAVGDAATDNYPRLMIFSHLHFCADGGQSTMCPIRALYCPSWQLPGAYVHGLGRGVVPEKVGTWWIWASDGEYKHKSWLHQPPSQKAIRLD